jgi:hypothetical protein
VSETSRALSLITESLRPEAGGPRAATRRRATADWTTTLRLANEHYLTPAMYVSLTQAHALADLADDLREYLAMLHQLNIERNQALRRQALELVEALNGVGIEPMLLKGGIALFSDLYADPGMRMLRDLDVLVPASAAHDAVRALQSLGYGAKTLYEAGHNAIGDFTREHDPGAVDLHVEIIDSPYLLPARDVWQRARAVQIVQDGAAKFFIPSPTDSVLHHLLHAQIHYLGNFYRGLLELRQIYEFVTMVRHYGDAIDWRFCIDRLVRHRLETPLQSYALAASRLFDLPWPLPSRPGAAAQLHYRRCLAQLAVPALGQIVVPVANIRAAFAWHRMNGLHPLDGPLPVQRFRHASQFLRKKTAHSFIGRLFRVQ